MTSRRHLLSRDRGSATLELVVLGPGLLAVLSAVLVAGRFEAAAGAVEQASAAAARAASLTRNSAAIQDASRQAAAATLDQHDLHCTNLDVVAETTLSSADAAGAVSAGETAVTVRCTLDLAAVSLPGVPGSRRISGRSVSVLDYYRSAA